MVTGLETMSFPETVSFTVRFFDLSVYSGAINSAVPDTHESMVLFLWLTLREVPKSKNFPS